MDTEIENGLNDFMEGLGESTNEPTEEIEVTEPTEETTETEATEVTEVTEVTEEPAEMFTLKVNKEERQVNRDEMTALAQKGADYDRVKAQLASRDGEIQSLREKYDSLSKYDGAIKMLDQLSKQNGTSIDDLVKDVRLKVKMSKGMTESEAELEMRAEDAEARAEKTETTEQRAAREVREFKSKFPDVELTKELCDELSEGVQSGKSLLEAYKDKKSSDKDTEITDLRKELEDLRKQMEAEKRNTENRRSSPGSQADSGGSSDRGDYDQFRAGLFS